MININNYDKVEPILYGGDYERLKLGYQECIRLLAKLYLQTKIIKTTYNYCSQIEGWYSRTISFS